MFAAILICLFLYFFLFKQKTAYEMRISDWSSDVCSSDLRSWRIGRNVLVRTDSGGGTHEFLDSCYRRRLGYLIGFTLTDDIVTTMDTERKSVVYGKSVSIRVDLGGIVLIQKERTINTETLNEGNRNT